MRRNDREITDKNRIYNIMKKCDCCSIAFFDKEYPYVIPMNFGVTFVQEQFTLYFHCANEGKKIELMQQNNHVAFEMNTSHNLILSQTPCCCTMKYESVCGIGIIERVSDNEKESALSLLMKQYNPQNNYQFNETELNAVTMLKLRVIQITGKSNIT